jgi:hypothetical protein
MPPDQDDEKARLSSKLARAVAKRAAGEEPDPKTATELKDLEHHQKGVEIAGIEQDISERKKYAMRFFFLSCVWLVLVAALLLFQGFGLWHFRLGEPVILAAIGATTVNVLGILYVVANYLFPTK